MWLFGFIASIYKEDRGLRVITDKDIRDLVLKSKD